MVRERWGTMEKETAAMGGLILEQDPSDKMAETAERKGDLKYMYKKDPLPYYTLNYKY